jgi:hypothetical protein
VKLHRRYLIFMFWLVTVIALPAFDFSAFAADSSLVYNSFGPGNTYSGDSSFVVGGSATAYGLQAHAEYFVPAFSGYLSQIQVATTTLGGGDALTDFSIAQDNGSGIPGTVLESFSNVTNPNGLLTLNSVTAPLLQVGQKYWLCDEPADTNAFVGWCQNNQGIINSCAVQTSASPGIWHAIPPSPASGVFSIGVVPIPEPATVGLVFLGVGAIAVRKKVKSVKRLPQMKLHCRISIFMFWLVTVIALPAFDFSASAASPSLVYSSFGPGNTYNNLSAWIVSGSATTYGLQAHAEYFVPAFSDYLSEIQVATIRFGGDALSDFSIASDNGSGIPGTVLESFSNVTNPVGLLTLNSVTAPLLQAGQKYWLCDEPADANSYVGWYLNNQGITNSYAYQNSTSPGIWQAIPSSVNGGASGVFSISVVPEPATVGLVFLGVGLVVRRRRI